MNLHVFRRPSPSRGFTLVELLVVVAIIAMLIGILLPALAYAMEIARRARSAANLHGIGQSLIAYNTSHDSQFPRAGLTDIHKPAIGFRADNLRGRDDVQPDDPDLTNNVTACLWRLVRDGSVTAALFINPSTTDRPDDQTDATGKPVPLDATWDFRWTAGRPKPLSYTTINMYHEKRRDNWSGAAPADWVLMADDNNADGPTLHRNSRYPQPTRQAVRTEENSLNHRSVGQTFLFTDAHTTWATDPFVGPEHDNVYARDKQTRLNGDEQPAPPTLECSNDTAPLTRSRRDVMLLPLEGNQHVNLSDGAKSN